MASKTINEERKQKDDPARSLADPVDEAISKSKEKWAKVFMAGPDSIVITRLKDGKIIDVNESFTRVMKYDRPETIGKTEDELENWLHPEHRLAYVRALERKGECRNLETSFRTKDGRIIPALISGRLVEIDGQPCLVAVIRDIAKFKVTEALLKESQIRYRAMVDAFDGLIYVCSQDYRVEFMNKKMIERTGREASGEYCYQVLHERAEICPWCVNERVFRGETVRWEIQSPKDNRWYYVVNTPIYHSDGRMSKQAVIIDITDRKQMEEALKRKSEEIKLFAYSVSHDLKNPAIALYGVAKLLDKYYGEMLDPRGQSYCQRLLKASEQVVELVERINLYISAKEVPLYVEHTEIKEILQTVREEFHHQLYARRIDWLEPEFIPAIKADRVSLLRVLRNLIDNALKYGGHELSRITIGYEETERHWIISVADDGVGLNPAESDHLFGLFHRLGTSRGVEGTGLGLAIVKEIAQRHGGQVWTSASEKNGITFHVSFAKDLPLSL